MASSLEEIGASVRAFLANDGSYYKAAQERGIDHKTMRSHIARARKEFPNLLAEPPPRAASDVLQDHRSNIERGRIQQENYVLREALASAEEKLTAFTSLRKAKPESLNWTLAAPNVAKRATLMPCLMLSDFQTGEVIRPGELDGMNAYNTDIFQERYKLAIEKTINLATKHVGSADFPGCMYWNLGDVVSGGLHLDLAETDDLPSVPAIRAVFQAEREGIKQLRAKFGRVRVVRVNGNHDRTTPKPRSKNQAGLSFGTLLSWWLETAFEDDDRVTFHTPASPDALVKVFGWNVILSHGDKMGSGGGKGFIGPEAPIIKGHHQLFKNWSDGGHVPDLICTGHYHTELKTVRGFGNGSLAGYSQYARDLRAIPDAARQWLLFMHPELKVAHQFSLQLSDRPQRVMLDYAA